MNGLLVLITNVALAERTGSEMYVHYLALALAALSLGACSGS